MKVIISVNKCSNYLLLYRFYQRLTTSDLSVGNNNMGVMCKLVNQNVRKLWKNGDRMVIYLGQWLSFCFSPQSAVLNILFLTAIHQSNKKQCVQSCKGSRNVNKCIKKLSVSSTIIAKTAQSMDKLQYMQRFRICQSIRFPSTAAFWTQWAPGCSILNGPPFNPIFCEHNNQKSNTHSHTNIWKMYTS